MRRSVKDQSLLGVAARDAKQQYEANNMGDEYDLSSTQQQEWML